MIYGSNAIIMAYKELAPVPPTDTRYKPDLYFLIFKSKTFYDGRGQDAAAELANPNCKVMIFFISRNDGIKHPNISKQSWHFIIGNEVYKRMSYRDVYSDDKKRRCGYRTTTQGYLTFIIKKIDVNAAEIINQIKL